MKRKVCTDLGVVVAQITHYLTKILNVKRLHIKNGAEAPFQIVCIVLPHLIKMWVAQRQILEQQKVHYSQGRRLLTAN